LPARIEEELKKLIKLKFEVSHMSNAKWRKLFTALDPVEIRAAYWKFVDLDSEFQDRFIKSDALMDKFVDDTGLIVGPFAYRRIEWLEIPIIAKDPIEPKVPFLNFEQNIQQIEVILNSIGHFKILKTKRGLRIVGHE
jgi:hypothetical protein